MIRGSVFNIQRFCVNDGPGIRTTVFFKGCPLRCAWCHNPESQHAAPELLYDVRRCLGCGRCVPVCPEGAHTLTEEGHGFDRTACRSCGACAAVCPGGALEMSGRTVTPDEVLDEVLRDKIFYETSGGGVTFSGGEPLAQPEFLLELLRLSKENGLHTAVETCGWCDAALLNAIAEQTDLFLFDYKLTDPALHEQYTGVSNRRILDNLALLNDRGAKVVLRCPVILGVNDTAAHFTAIGETAEHFAAVDHVELEPYHPLGLNKSRLLGRAAAYDNAALPEQTSVNGWLAAVQAATAKEVRQA